MLLALGSIRQGNETEVKRTLYNAALKRGEDPTQYSSEPLFRNEPILDVDESGNPYYRKSLEALAQVIQNIIVFHKGNFPNDPGLGVGISDYMFELSDDKTLRDIEQNIASQINRYVAHNGSYVNVDVSMYKSNNLKAQKDINTLIVSVTIQPTNNTTYSDTEIELNYAISLNTRNKRFVSKLIYD